MVYKENMSEMLPDLQSSLLCDDVRQEINGKYFLIGLFDSIAAHKFPLTYSRLVIVNRWCSGEGNFQEISRIVRPDQTTPLVEGQAIPIRLPNPVAHCTNVQAFMNLKFEEPGVHWVEVLLNNQLKVRYPLRVAQVVVKRPPQPDVPPAE